MGTLRKSRKEDELLADLREGRKLGGRRAALLVWLLSLPTILAELSSVAMEYIDAAMVGRIGAQGAASIGLVASTTWLFWGMLRASSTGFAVQVAQRIGARRDGEARAILLQGFVANVGVSVAIGAIGAAISGALPHWLGGDASLARDASRYFLVYMLGMPVIQLPGFASRILQAAGDMRRAGVLNTAMCALDVVFNYIFIFPSRSLSIAGARIIMPGFGMGVTGAAVGTVVAEAIAGTLMAWALLVRHPTLRMRRGEPLRFDRAVLAEAARIGLPVAFESAVMTGAMVMSTAIVAPLGAVALAANSFAIIAESICYMPGYGIASAAMTLVGQAVGAGRRAMARRFAWICTGMGAASLGATAALLFVLAPWTMAILSPDAEVASLGAAALRIGIIAEPLFAASMVASGALRGAGDSLVPSLLNFASMWGVRIPLMTLLTPRMGLRGAWLSMALELTVRCCLMLMRLSSPRWTRRHTHKQ